jgi:hypothetical protein
MAGRWTSATVPEIFVCKGSLPGFPESPLPQWPANRRYVTNFYAITQAIPSAAKETAGNPRSLTTTSANSHTNTSRFLEFGLGLRTATCEV